VKARERDRKLDALYAELPTIHCQGKCEESCGPIEMTRAERDRIVERTGKPLAKVDKKLTCPLLTPAGWCSVYSIRPAICRIWGLVPSMKCPYGCVPEGGFLLEEQGFEWMQRVFDAMGEQIEGSVGTMTASFKEIQRLSMEAHFREGGNIGSWLRKGMERDHQRAGRAPLIER
jgi:Fe-S-cluster containining protein